MQIIELSNHIYMKVNLVKIEKVWDQSKGDIGWNKEDTSWNIVKLKYCPKKKIEKESNNIEAYMK